MQEQKISNIGRREEMDYEEKEWIWIGGGYIGEKEERKIKVLLRWGRKKRPKRDLDARKLINSDDMGDVGDMGYVGDWAHLFAHRMKLFHTLTSIFQHSNTLRLFPY